MSCPAATWSRKDSLTSSAALNRYRRPRAVPSSSGRPDSDFTIAAPSITVTAPNTGVSLGAGSRRQIKWNHNLGTGEAVDIDLSTDDGASCSPIASGVPNTANTTGTYAWVVPPTLTTQARVRVTWANPAATNDMSNAPFTIAAPFVKVTAPNTAVTWLVGETRNITWSHNLGTEESVKIELTRDGGVSSEQLAGSVANTANGSGRSRGWSRVLPRPRHVYG